MRTRPFAELVADARADPVRRERIAQLRRAMQDAVVLAETLAVTQANVSRIEHEEHLYLSTLRTYVAALGGELELRAVFSERTVTLAAGTRS